jgi:hypothetical protein
LNPEILGDGSHGLFWLVPATRPSPCERWVKIYEKFGQKGLSDNPTIISLWKKAFLGDGTEGLKRPKGRPSMSDTAKNKKDNPKVRFSL